MKHDEQSFLPCFLPSFSCSCQGIGSKPKHQTKIPDWCTPQEIGNEFFFDAEKVVFDEFCLMLIKFFQAPIPVGRGEGLQAAYARRFTGFS